MARLVYLETEYSETGDSDSESDPLVADEYVDCEEKLNCKIPEALTDFQGIITYSNPADCPAGTMCRNSQKCGAKGKMICFFEVLHLRLRQFFSHILTLSCPIQQ